MSAYLNDEMRPSQPGDARYVLAMINPPGFIETTQTRPYWVEFLKECGHLIGIRFGEDLIAYYDLRLVSIYTPAIMAVCGAALAGNFRAGLDSWNHRDFYSQPVELTPPACSLGEVLQMIEATKDFPVSKITQDHHMYITRRELREAYEHRWHSQSYESNYRRSVAMMLYEYSEKLGIQNRVSIITHLVYVAVAPLFAVKHLATMAAMAPNEEWYMSTLKAESAAAKQLQTLFRDDLAAVFELTVLRNRVYDSVDWDKEIEHRTRPKTVPIDPRKVYEISRRIFQDAAAAGARQRKQSWREYWELRWSHMPVGSVVSQYSEDMLLKKSLPQDARVKAAWFAANTHDDYEYWHSRQPQIYASTSTKYEWGKVRALYGCDVTSFLHADFAMSDCEDTLPAYFPVGSKANESYVRDVISKFKDGVPFCYDFDDFNAQHSTRSMQQVIRAWGDTFAHRLTNEQKKSLIWTIESLGDQRVRFNDVGKTVTINGTLMSGWRLTSFINSVLNRVYLEAAQLHQTAIYSLHNGDDVYATTPTVLDAVRIAARARNIGVRAQMAKMNIGTIGEFLRIDARATNPTGAQYLARAVATATHGRVEIAPANDMRELVRSMDERHKAIIKRGGDSKAVEVMLKRTFKFIVNLFESSWDVLEAMFKYHPLQGGMNEKAEVGGTTLIKRIMGEEEITVSAFEPIRRGVNDYANAVIKQLKLRFDEADRQQMFIKAVRGLVRKKIRYEIVIERTDDILIYRGLYGVWDKGGFITAITKARSLGFTTATQLRTLNSTLAKMIRNAKDPIRFMNAVMK